MTRERELSNLIFEVIMDRNTMFYGFFLSELNKSFTPDKRVETAAVSKHASSVNIELMFNPEYWDEIGLDEKVKGNKQRQFTLFHEVCHVIYEHIQGSWDWLVKDKVIGNLAMDMFINQTLIKTDAPEGVIFPESFPNLQIPYGEGTEFYYKLLEKAKQNKKVSQDKGEPNGKGEPGKGTSGDTNLDDHLENNEDYHITWEDLTKNMSDNEKKLLDKQIQKSLAEAVEQTEKSRGTIPVHLKDALIKKLEVKLPVTDWKLVVRQFAGNSQKVENYRTRKRENFRFPDTPANKTKQKPSIAVCVDTSGSVGEKELQEFFNEIYHIWKAGVFVDLVHWDTQVHLVEEYKGQREVKRVSSGGTFMSSAVEHINKNRKKYDCAIILSDGFVEGEVLSPKIPTLVVISSNGNINVNIKCKKIKIK